MTAKGTSLTSTYNFVKDKFLNKIEDWMQSLPTSSQKLFSEIILATHWYPVQEGLIIPTEKIGDLFFNGNRKKASWELGRNSAEIGLKGVYSIFSTYYSDSKFTIIDQSNTFATFLVEGFYKEDFLILHRIAGWIEKGLEIVGERKKDINIEIKDKNEKLNAIIYTKWN